MVPDDDFLLSRPARRESATILRISLMAVMGCLVLLSVLAFQARAEPEVQLYGPAGAVEIQEHPAPAGEKEQTGSLRTTG